MAQVGDELACERDAKYVPRADSSDNTPWTMPVSSAGAAQFDGLLLTA